MHLLQNEKVAFLSLVPRATSLFFPKKHCATKTALYSSSDFGQHYHRYAILTDQNRFRQMPETIGTNPFTQHLHLLRLQGELSLLCNQPTSIPYIRTTMAKKN